MVTALAAQLARLRAQSTNPLDLKAQRKAHSQSILFDSAVAATQDFDSLYQLCNEGFEELCRLDLRFTSFTKSLFSEQSKREDRAQMTLAQNKQLDTVIEEFLSLIGGKLLLKPALKAIEWLVRRFRAHEHNTQYLVLSFLPYHAAPLFLTLLSILPQKLPQTLKFLYPYVQSLANPPRHAVIYSASNNRTFFAAMSAHVLQSCRLNHGHVTLVTFWSSVATEAIASMLDEARSARRESQNQNQEDIIHMALPVLSDGLSLERVPELKIGCYMILTVLASKTDLQDEVLTAFMEAVIADWTETSHAGLICLSVLAQQRQSHRLPKSVFKAILALKTLEDDLKILRIQYKVEKLTLGLVLGILGGIGKARDASQLRLVRTLIEANLMSEVLIAQAIQAVLSAAQTLRPESSPDSDMQASLTDLILRLADSQAVGPSVRAILQISTFDVTEVEARLQRVINNGAESLRNIEDAEIDMEDANEKSIREDFDALTSRIPTRTAYEISFLSHSDSCVFGSLENVFSAISASPTNIRRFSDLPVLRKPLAMSEPLFLSFFIRMWCGNTPAPARAASIRTVCEYLKQKELSCDVQLLLPYLIFGLSDPSPKVRFTMKELTLTLLDTYAKAIRHEKKDVRLPILGQEQIYGQGKETTELSWLSMNECLHFLQDLLAPGLEECVLDQNHVSQLLAGSLNSSRHSTGSNATRKELKTSLRTAIFTSLCSHVVHTPLHGVKFRLLQMLNQVPKVGSTSRAKLLLPLLSKYARISRDEVERICHNIGIEGSELLHQVVGVITPTDREGVQELRSIIQCENQSQCSGLRLAALGRLQSIWASMKLDMQNLFAKELLDQAVGAKRSDLNEIQVTEAMETLRTLPLSNPILQSFVEGLPTISSSLHAKPPASKRRRTSHGQSAIPVVPSPKETFCAIRRITIVLELVEDAKATSHPELLKGLYRIMSDLQHSGNYHNTKADYLQILTMDSMLAIVKKLESPSGFLIDRSLLRADVLVDCIRTTDSPQVRNTALLLVSALATVVPELVLHNVMPIFTFMGANVLHQNDEFSVYVVKKTMESIVPRLVQSLHKRKEGPFVGVSELLLSFAAAFEHIPSQRRLGLFTSLIDKVGSRDYLFALFVILIDKYPNNRKVVQFMVELGRRYDVDTRLQTIKRYLETVVDARNSKPTHSTALLTSINHHSLEDTVANLLPLASSILSDADLIANVFKTLRKDNSNLDAARASYIQILEQIFLLSEQCKGSKRMGIMCMQVLDASLGLLPLSELVGTLQDLLARTDNNIHRQVLRSFEYRLNDQTVDQTSSQTACLAFLPQLVSIIEESTDIPLKHTAIACVDRITERFGKKDITAVIETAKIVAGERGLGAAEGSLRIISLLCLATMVEACSDSFVSVIPQTFSIAINYLETSLGEKKEDANLHNAVYSFFGALLLYVPWTVTGADLDQLLTASAESANAEWGEECDRSRVGVLNLVAKQAEPKECFAALKRTWTRTMIEGPSAVKDYLEILGLAIDRQPNSTIVKSSEILGDLLLQVFDLRRTQLSPPTIESYDQSEIDQVEGAVNDCAIAMVYKLNDATFRPLFLRILEWATTPTTKGDNGTLHRQITLYTFLARFFYMLKSIVTSYANFIIEDSVKILNATSPSHGDSMELWRRVVVTLHKTFEHDQDDFFQNPAHFGPISAALLKQFAHAAQVPLLPELIPAITELAVATDSPTHHKEMNATILKYMRSDSSLVRLAAVQCEIALTRRLGEEWLALLPEMLPFISEALEDDDEEVEKAVQSFAASIEDILGESLNPMLQ